MGNSVGCKRSVIDEKDDSKNMGRERVSTVSTLSDAGSNAAKNELVLPEDPNSLYVGMFKPKYEKREEKKRPPSGGQDSGNDGVVRRAFHKLTPRDQDRVVNAMDRMMKEGSFFKHGSLHGWPSTYSNGKWGYCVHSYQRFVTWHREYLRGFELDMQRADRANGNDGNIGLPYWDWLASPNFPRKMQRWLEYPREGIPSQHRNFDRLRSEVRNRYVRNGTFDMRINTFIPDKSHEVRGSFQLGHFGQYSNKRGQKPGGFQDIESIHDSVHGALGGIVGELDVAAFHPAFWLHHCMIDRLFETYLFFEPDSMSEMSRSEIEQRLEPFGSTSRRDFLWRHDGYRYDSIATAYVPQSVQQNVQINMMMQRNPGWQPPQPTLTRLGESPEHHTNPTKFAPETNVSFKVDVKKLQGDSWPVKIFALPQGQQMDVPFNQPAMWRRSRWLVGDSGILHSRDVTTCSACQDAEPFNFDVPIGRGLQRLGVNRHQVTFVIWFQNGAGQPFTAEDLYRRGILGGHTVTGPFFCDTRQLQIGAKSEDCRMLQLYLKVFGWYDGVIDGVFSEKTKQGVMGFQKFFGLQVDGLVHDRTKDFIVNKFRMDDEEDTNGDVVFWPKGSRVTYKVMSAPMYLDRNQLLLEIDQAFDAWEPFGNYDFVRVQHNQQADIEISFQDHAAFNILAAEGRGGILARSDKNHIQFNEDEKWMLRNSRIPRLGGFYLYNVCLHQVGKVIGLSNSPDPRDAMYPFYNATKTQLGGTEQKAASSLLQAGRPVQPPHPRQSQMTKQVQPGFHDDIPLDTYAQQKARWAQSGGRPAPMQAPAAPAVQASAAMPAPTPAVSMPAPAAQAPVSLPPRSPFSSPQLKEGVWTPVDKVEILPDAIELPSPAAQIPMQSDAGFPMVESVGMPMQNNGMGMPMQNTGMGMPMQSNLGMGMPMQASTGFAPMPVMQDPAMTMSSNFSSQPSLPSQPMMAPSQNFGGGMGNMMGGGVGMGGGFGGAEEFKEYVQPQSTLVSEFNAGPIMSASPATSPFMGASSPQPVNQWPAVMSSTDEFTLSDARAPAPTFLGARGTQVDDVVDGSDCDECERRAADILSRPTVVRDL